MKYENYVRPHQGRIEIGARLYVMAFTMRGSDMRVISLRKANQRERGEYEEKKG